GQHDCVGQPDSANRKEPLAEHSGRLHGPGIRVAGRNSSGTVRAARGGSLVPRRTAGATAEGTDGSAAAGAWEDRGVMQVACGSKEVELPLSRSPLRGKAGVGGSPPRRWHAARQPKALSRIDAAAPPTRGAAAPLVHPPAGSQRGCTLY